eukprot:3365771-Lingulodinium_polyedra.AAC.1
MGSGVRGANNAPVGPPASAILARKTSRRERRPASNARLLWSSFLRAARRPQLVGCGFPRRQPGSSSVQTSAAL